MYDDNGFANCYEELKTFYPIFYLDVFEMNAILSAHGKLSDDIISNINLVVDNNFIDNADEATITRLEKFLWLDTDKTRPLEERKRLVFSFFVGYGKISASKIKDMVRSFTDADSTVTFEPGDEAGNNYLTIIIERGKVEKLFFADIATVLFKKLPAHISYKTIVRYSFPSVVSAKRKHFIHDYELCGLTPEPALIGVIRSKKTIAEEQHNHLFANYKATKESELCGLEPAPALLGQIYSKVALTRATTQSTTLEYKVAGELPERALIGEKAEINAGTAFKTTAVSVDYTPCGTIVAKA